MGIPKDTSAQIVFNMTDRGNKSADVQAKFAARRLGHQIREAMKIEPRRKVRENL